MRRMWRAWSGAATTSGWWLAAMTWSTERGEWLPTNPRLRRTTFQVKPFTTLTSNTSIRRTTKRHFWRRLVLLKTMSRECRSWSVKYSATRSKTIRTLKISLPWSKFLQDFQERIRRQPRRRRFRARLERCLSRQDCSSSPHESSYSHLGSWPSSTRPRHICQTLSWMRSPARVRRRSLPERSSNSSIGLQLWVVRRSKIRRRQTQPLVPNVILSRFSVRETSELRGNFKVSLERIMWTNSIFTLKEENDLITELPKWKFVWKTTFQSLAKLY